MDNSIASNGAFFPGKSARENMVCVLYKTEAAARPSAEQLLEAGEILECASCHCVQRTIQANQGLTCI